MPAGMPAQPTESRRYKENPLRRAVRLCSVMRSLGLLFACCAFAQAPTVGAIDFYGLRSVSAERILAAARLKTGDPIPPSKGELEDRIAELPGVVLARVEAVCCEGPQAILF